MSNVCVRESLQRGITLQSIVRIHRNYDPALDGLRCVAIIAAVMFHASENLFPGGWMGVDIFFVLSGYLITRILAGEIDDCGQIGYRLFYIRRFLRLTPALWCLLGLELLCIVANGNWRSGIWAASMTAGYLMNWNRAFVWGAQDILGHTWSLAIEEQFYLVWPITLAFIRPRRPRAWLLTGIMTVITWRSYLVVTGVDPGRTYNGFDTHCDGLLIGCYLALTPLHPRVLRVLAKWAVAPIVFLLAVILGLNLRMPLVETGGLTFVALCAAWLLLASSQNGWLRRFLCQRTMVYTGRISYSLYIWHYPILLLGAKHLLFDGARFLLVAASYFVAVASFHFIEQPFLRLKSRFKPVATSPLLE
jgi:peptidoglycan/LPS O-acetylase OafA/YrhL